MKDLRKNCKSLQTHIVLDRKHKFLDGEISVGSEAYFTPDAYLDYALIKVSTKGRSRVEWLCNLLHEVGHAEQYHEWVNTAFDGRSNFQSANETVWGKTAPFGEDATELSNDWVDGNIELADYRVAELFQSLVELEKDAEVRAIALMVKYGLIPRFVSMADYSQHAWAYIYSYFVTALTRKWIPASAPPYQVRAIVKAMPKSLESPIDLAVVLPLFQKHYKSMFELAK
ncbi:MAG: hypothetical protein ACREQ5_07065 [Candidatus Dormibacteria bacterium]